MTSGPAEAGTPTTPRTRESQGTGENGDMSGTHGPRVLSGLVFLGVISATLSAARGADAPTLPAARGTDAPTLDQAANEYTSTARPLLPKYCLKCHSTELIEGDLDPER